MKIPLLKVYTDLVLVFLPQILFVTSVWFHFGVTLILLSPFAQDLQILVFLTQF